MAKKKKKKNTNRERWRRATGAAGWAASKNKQPAEGWPFDCRFSPMEGNKTHLSGLSFWNEPWQVQLMLLKAEIPDPSSDPEVAEEEAGNQWECSCLLCDIKAKDPILKSLTCGSINEK